MDVEESSIVEPSGVLLPLRLLIALAQGLALYGLMDALDSPPCWPGTDPFSHIPLKLVAVFVPILAILGLGRIRARPLLIWLLAVAAVVAVLGYFSVARAPSSRWLDLGETPWIRLGIVLVPGLFIANLLVVGAISERRLFPAYAPGFDGAWKQLLQMVLAVLFVAVFWGTLHLGAALFKLVGIHVLERLIDHRWFFCPATTLAAAVSLHVTDVQPSLIRGTRAIVVGLFSWLLPLMVVMVGGFLLSLPFISLAPLWNTHFATRLLLAAAGVLMAFINACYRPEPSQRGRIGRIAATAGAFELPVLIGLAVWALSLRVGQHGWTEDRILAAAVILLAFCPCIGHVLAAIKGFSRARPFEIANVAACYLFLALILALFTPLADPARLMVLDQVARLESGMVTPGEFDFAALKFDGERWGAAALDRLEKIEGVPDARAIREMALRAREQRDRSPESPPLTNDRQTRENFARQVAVFPEGRRLPDGFYDLVTKWPGMEGRRFLSCLNDLTRNCVARYVALRPGEPEVILFDDDAIPPTIYGQDGAGNWRREATLIGPWNCPSVRKALDDGGFALAPHDWPDLLAGDQRLTIRSEQESCR